MMREKIQEFLASKWFLAVMMIIAFLILPTTFGNVKVLYEKNAMGQYWYLVVVFIFNILWGVIALWKFMGSFGKKAEPPMTSSQW